MGAIDAGGNKFYTLINSFLDYNLIDAGQTLVIVVVAIYLTTVGDRVTKLEGK